MINNRKVYKSHQIYVIMINEKLDLDEKDITVVSLFMQNPHISQAEIASKLNISQPSVNFRVQKLRKKEF